MRKINWLLVKKKVGLFCLLVVLAFLMNLFLWNETSQLIRQLPELRYLKQVSQEGIHEIIYLPNSDKSGRILTIQPKEQEKMLGFLEKFFFDSKEGPTLYENKQEYLTNFVGENKSGKLMPVTQKKLNQELAETAINPMFMNDLLVLTLTPVAEKNFEEKVKEFPFSLRLISLKERFQIELNYYRGNFLFGLTFSLIFFSFILAVTYWIISSSLSLYKQELNLLRVIGLSNQKVINNYTGLLIIPPFIGFMTFLIVINLSEIGLILLDYSYLSFLNVLVWVFIHLIIKRKVRRMWDA